MGYYRFLLATFVALSHTNLYMPINLGVSSVIVFYFISGYLISISYENFKIKTNYSKTNFYIDRILRLFPSYILVFFITLIFFLIFDLDNATNLMIDNERFFNLQIFKEMLMIPNSFAFLTTSSSSNIIPPGWSLGVEMQFYFLLPFLVLLKIKKRMVLLILLVFLHLLALLNSNYLFDYITFCDALLNEGKCWIVLNELYRFEILNSHISDIFGYRSILFTLAVFLFGNICYECFIKGNKYKYFIYLIVFIYVFSFFIFLVGDLLKNKHTIEVLIAAIVLIPLSFNLLEKIRKRKTISWLDSFFGKLAYPVFLSHFLAIWTIEIIIIDSNDQYKIPLIMTVCFIYSLGIMYFQNFVDKFRYKVRGFKRTTKDYLKT